MKRTINLLPAMAALLATLNLSGCMVLDGESYHNDRGDLVSNDGSIRYVGWCEVHPHGRGCGPERLAAVNTQPADNAD
jgi:hypothetical protein